jgi:acetyl esterase/lipase
VIDADMTLRFGRLRVPTIVRWPRVETVSLALVLSDELSPTDPWVAGFVVVGLAGRHPSSVELAALQWMSDHACELGGRRDRMLVAGGARAARLALAARDSGRPALWGQLLVHPVWGAEQPMPWDVAGAPPATVVCGAGADGGRRYGERLRAAGVEVHEVRDEVSDDRRR